MYRFKSFDSTQCGDSMAALEAVINVWMQEERPHIRHMCQSIRGEHILLSFTYEDTDEPGQQIALQALAQNELTGITGGFPRIFDDDISVEDPPTSPRIPATPPMPIRNETLQ